MAGLEAKNNKQQMKHISVMLLQKNGVRNTILEQLTSSKFLLQLTIKIKY